MSEKEMKGSYPPYYDDQFNRKRWCGSMAPKYSLLPPTLSYKREYYAKRTGVPMCGSVAPSYHLLPPTIAIEKTQQE